MTTHHHKWLNELTVVGVFFAVIAIGLVYALFHLNLTPTSPAQPAAPVVKAPTIEEYQSEARSVLAPFLEQAAAVDSGSLAAADEVFGALIDKTQERLLRVRVPAQARETHLSFVLLLEQWRRALKGSAADQDRAADMTVKLTSANPWLLLNQ